MTSGRTYSSTSTPKVRFLRNLSMVGDLFTLRVFTRNLPKENRRTNIIFHISCLTWNTNQGFTSNKPTHHLLDYADFKFYIDCKQGSRRVNILFSQIYPYEERFNLSFLKCVKYRESKSVDCNLINNFHSNLFFFKEIMLSPVGLHR